MDYDKLKADMAEMKERIMAGNIPHHTREELFDSSDDGVDDDNDLVALGAAGEEVVLRAGAPDVEVNHRLESIDEESVTPAQAQPSRARSMEVDREGNRRSYTINKTTNLPPPKLTLASAQKGLMDNNVQAVLLHIKDAYEHIDSPVLWYKFFDATVFSTLALSCRQELRHADVLPGAC